MRVCNRCKDVSKEAKWFGIDIEEFDKRGNFKRGSIFSGDLCKECKTTVVKQLKELIS